MDYKSKYINYKLKYFNYKKNIQKGGSDYITYGINFESGKIINHIKKYSNLIAYANCQIAMDAPYHGRVADETIRSKGRSETQFIDYKEYDLMISLGKIFSYIKKTYPSTQIIIQIARGRSGISMFNEVIFPILEILEIPKIQYKIIYGYRSTDYYVPMDSNKFIFINIGMFAVLSNIKNVKVGELCNVQKSYSIKSYDNSGFKINKESNEYNDVTNILNHLDFQKICLYGIADDMAFIIPDIYKKEHIQKLLQ
jgi:hypothetical protein